MCNDTNAEVIINLAADLKRRVGKRTPRKAQLDIYLHDSEHNKCNDRYSTSMDTL